jgi:hypothetical protein
VELRVTADQKQASAKVSVQGDFHSAAEIGSEEYSAFAAFTPVALLWPYARAYVDQLYSMLGVQVPPLPTLDAMNIVMGPEQREGERGS